jgi:hypothetical protein
LNIDATYLPKPFYIRHHGGPNKPWSKDKLECEPRIVGQWRKDLAESPWPDKFLPEEKRQFLRTYIRPITRAVEVPIKAAIRGDFETILHGEKDRRPIKRYLQLLPSLLRKAEEAAREGRLAAAL